MSTEASDRRRGSIEDGDSLLPPAASTSTSAPAPAAPSSEAADDDAEAAELAAMRARVAEMEAEAAKLRELTAASEASSGGGADGTDVNMSDEDREAVDARSVYVGNVDYNSTPEEIQQHFASCGTINRVTILFDKYTGPKGRVGAFASALAQAYAYVEFADPSLVANAVLLNESMFRGRQLKVSPKRTNLPGMGARGRGRGRGRGGYRGGYQGHGGFSPYARGGRGRGRGRGSF
ncbi:hypothetical protein JCM10449v2_001826 [Rhodotorula kratochvilovae]